MNIAVTGTAGFIGMHVAAALLARGHQILGIDDLNAYYDPALKQARLARLQSRPGFRFERLDIADPRIIELLRSGRFEAVVHLAAQAGVRHSIEAPLTYGAANLTGFTHVLEGCRHGQVRHLLFASSSSRIRSRPPRL